jgi:hypothetical protein
MEGLDFIMSFSLGIIIGLAIGYFVSSVGATRLPGKNGVRLPKMVEESRTLFMCSNCGYKTESKDEWAEHKCQQEI